MVYRPTVRYDDVYKKYVDDLFQATELDRNQIMRLGLFLLGHTEEGTQILKDHATTSLPSPPWSKDSKELWLAQVWLDEYKERDVKPVAKEGRHESERREGSVQTVKFNNTGGIKLFIK